MTATDSSNTGQASELGVGGCGDRPEMKGIGICKRLARYEGEAPDDVAQVENSQRFRFIRTLNARDD